MKSLLLTVFLPVFLFSCSFDSSGPGNISTTNNTSPVCGNGVREDGEACDKTVESSCVQLGFSGGTLTCTDTCTFDISGCTQYCGECEIGSAICTDNKIFQCVNDGNDCGLLQLSDNCSDTSSWCQENSSGAYCSANCMDQCTDGESKCSGDLSSILLCKSVATGNDNFCLLWMTEEECTSNFTCSPVSMQCEAFCANDCATGESSCSDDLTARLICVEEPAGCFNFVESACPTGTQCAENNSSSVCDCNICEEGETSCTENSAFVMSCIENEQGCFVWEQTEQCSYIEMQACIVSGEVAECGFSGNDCSQVHHLTSLPFSTIIEDFSDSYTNEMSFDNSTCGPTFGGAPEVILSINLHRGDTIRIERTSGIDVAIRVQSDCDNTQRCLAYKYGNSLDFTAFEEGTYFISVEKTGPGNGSELSLSISGLANVCDVVETEINDTVTTADILMSVPSYFCNSITPADDTDCIKIPVEANQSIVATRYDILGDSNCPEEVELQLFEPGNNLIYYKNGGNLVECPEIRPEFSSELLYTSPGDYHLCITSGSGENDVPSGSVHIEVVDFLTVFDEEMNTNTCIDGDWSQQLFPYEGRDNIPPWSCDVANGCVTVSSLPQELGSRVLTTPEMDLSSASGVIIVFDIRISIYAQLQSFPILGQVIGTNDSYATQSIILEQIENSITSWTQVMVDASEFAGNPGVKFGFKYTNENIAVGGKMDVRNIKIITY